MSDNAIESYHDMEESIEKLKRPRKSGWMAHWMRASCSPPPLNEQEDDYSSNNRDVPVGPEVEGGNSELVKGYRERTETKLIDSMDESLTTSSKKLRSKPMGFPAFSSSLNRKNVLVPKNGETSRYHEGALTSDLGLDAGINVRNKNCLPSMHVQASSGTEAQIRESQVWREGIVWNQEQKVKASKLVEKSDLAVSKHFQDNLLGTTSEIVGYEFNDGRTSIEPSLGGQDNIYKSNGALLVPEKRMDKKAALLIHNPSTSSNWRRGSVGKSQKAENHSEMQLFHSHISHPDISKFEKLYHGSYGQQGLASSVHDVENMRIYTTIDSVNEFSRGPPKFSQTTHHLLITKKTEVDISDGDQIFRKLSIPSKLKGKAVSEFLSLSQDFGFNVKQGLKLQPLDSSSESERKGILDNVKTSAVNSCKESSADTDTMEMDAFQENHLSGVALCPSKKDVDGSRKMLAPDASKLPDTYQELPVFPDIANAEDENESTSSRTQSLDVDHLLFHAERATKLESNACHNAMSGLDPFSRWIKRLKPNSSDSVGTKSLRMEEASSHERVNKFFCKILKSSKTCSESQMAESYGKEHIKIKQTNDLPRIAGSSSSDSARKSQEITLSHAWIQRWRHNEPALPEMKHEASVVCEPKSSKTILDFEKKQFPSIAAMALMGKAITSMRSCKFRKKGSSVVWNANR